ncbi:MAG: phosphoserine phosphatase SerB [Alphaproteobacteria bacterium]|nr:phosphoserine phosphatase SerB [Alphaproteobacteria bacterium]
MRKVLTIVSNEDNIISNNSFEAIQDLMNTKTRNTWLKKELACDLYFDDTAARIDENLFNYLDQKQFDWAIQEDFNRNKKLFLSDMDSTIIKQECIDELAHYAGVREEVSLITEKSMKGEINFTEAFIERVTLLEGMNINALDEVYLNIELNDGADLLLKNLSKQNIYTVLVSGGFTYFTDKLSEKLGFKENYANRLEILNKKITGKVIPPIIDGNAKKNILDQITKKMQLNRHDVVSVGDGANDVEMISNSALGVSYHGKHILRNKANAQINHTNLTSILYFIGLREADIIY